MYLHYESRRKNLSTCVTEIGDRSRVYPIIMECYEYIMYLRCCEISVSFGLILWFPFMMNLPSAAYADSGTILTLFTPYETKVRLTKNESFLVGP